MKRCQIQNNDANSAKNASWPKTNEAYSAKQQNYNSLFYSVLKQYPLNSKFGDSIWNKKSELQVVRHFS